MSTYCTSRPALLKIIHRKTNQPDRVSQSATCTSSVTKGGYGRTDNMFSR